MRNMDALIKERFKSNQLGNGGNIIEPQMSTQAKI